LIENVDRERVEEDCHDVTGWKIKIHHIQVQRYDIGTRDLVPRVVSDVLAAVLMKTARKLHSNDAPERQSCGGKKEPASPRSIFDETVRGDIDSKRLDRSQQR
jgi:hypothetical protein